MHAHREQSKTSPGDRVVAVFRETVLPCLPEGATSSAAGGREAPGSAAEVDFAWERRSADDLVAAGVARVVRLRGLAGEARGSTMASVAEKMKCMRSNRFRCFSLIIVDLCALFCILYSVFRLSINNIPPEV